MTYPFGTIEWVNEQLILNIKAQYPNIGVEISTVEGKTYIFINDYEIFRSKKYQLLVDNLYDSFMLKYNIQHYIFSFRYF